ncbi:MAG: ATP-grasp domain-containing protein [Oscillospiraceae bacterium]|nr:ATP-grasp domain-containing protein [Oscillospiraceae bacterium]
MKKYRILVTAVGAIVGYGIISALRDSGYDIEIIGCDIYEEAVGRYFADDFVVSSPAADPFYPEFLKNLIDEKQIDLVLFGIEQEISSVYMNMEKFEGYLSRLVINNPDIIPLCDDKWQTYMWLNEHNLEQYAIDSVINGNFEDISDRFGTPFLIKPRISRGSKGIVSISAAFDFDYHKAKLGSNFMAQPIVSDQANEYTVGLFGLGDGSYINEIYLRRTLSQEGATAKAWTVEDTELKAAVEAITAVLKPEGPTNYQFRKQQEKVFLLEINPRISSSVSIRSKFSYNEAKMSIEYYLEGKRPDRVEVKKGKAIRYISDLVLGLW